MEAAPQPNTLQRLAAGRALAMRAYWGPALVLAAVAVNVTIWAEIARIAITDAEASHILLVPLVAGWLVWVRRDALAHAQPASSALGPLVMAGGAVLSYLGFNHAVQSFWHGGAVIVLVGSLITVLGANLSKRLAPALLVLIFLVPIPGTVRQQVAIPLQTATAQITQVIYDLLAIEIQRHGNVLHFRGEPVAVAEACNGMRMVSVLVLVCYAVAFAYPLRTSVRVAVLVLSPLCALACNVIRLVPSVWFYGYDPQILGPIFHDLSGWAMVLIAFGLVMGFLGLLRWLELPIMRDPPPTEQGAP